MPSCPHALMPSCTNDHFCHTLPSPLPHTCLLRSRHCPHSRRSNLLRGSPNPLPAARCCLHRDCDCDAGPLLPADGNRLLFPHLSTRTCSRASYGRESITRKVTIGPKLTTCGKPMVPPIEAPLASPTRASKKYPLALASLAPLAPLAPLASPVPYMFIVLSAPALLYLHAPNIQS